MQDKFVAMVNAKVEVDLRLSDFQPVSELRTPVHHIEQPRFPVIDYHNHLDSLEPADVLRIMDQCGIEKIVNITMRTGDTALRIMDNFHEASPTRFHSIGWMDWEGVERDDFVPLTLTRLEKMAEHGACGIKFWKDFGLTLTDATGKLLRIDDTRFAPIFDKAAELGFAVMFHTVKQRRALLESNRPRNSRLETHPYR